MYSTLFYCTPYDHATLNCTVLYFTLLYCTVLYCTVLYCTEPYCTVLHYNLLYCIAAGAIFFGSYFARFSWAYTFCILFYLFRSYEYFLSRSLSVHCCSTILREGIFYRRLSTSVSGGLILYFLFTFTIFSKIMDILKD